MTEELQLGQLWDNYGIVGDVVVSIFLSSLLRNCVLPEPFCMMPSVARHNGSTTQFLSLSFTLTLSYRPTSPSPCHCCPLHIVLLVPSPTLPRHLLVSIALALLSLTSRADVRCA